MSEPQDRQDNLTQKARRGLDEMERGESVPYEEVFGHPQDRRVEQLESDTFWQEQAEALQAHVEDMGREMTRLYSIAEELAEALQEAQQLLHPAYRQAATQICEALARFDALKEPNAS